MPRAGKASANRAYAHYRWAQRYAKAGKLNHAIPHFGRGLHYDELAFGGQDDDDDDRVTGRATRRYDSRQHAVCPILLQGRDQGSDQPNRDGDRIYGKTGPIAEGLRGL